jgi:hypothetical protein
MWYSLLVMIAWLQSVFLAPGKWVDGRRARQAQTKVFLTVHALCHTCRMEHVQAGETECDECFAFRVIW